MTLLTTSPAQPALHWQHHARADRRAVVVVQPVGLALRIVVGDLAVEEPAPIAGNGAASVAPPLTAPVAPPLAAPVASMVGDSADAATTPATAGPLSQWSRRTLDRRAGRSRLVGHDASAVLSDPCLQVAVDDLCRTGGWHCALGVDLGAGGTVTVAGSGGPGAIVAGTGRPGRLVPEVPDGRPHVLRLAEQDVLVLCTPAYLADPPAALRQLRLGGSPSAALRYALLDPTRPGAVAVVRHAPRQERPA